MERPPAKPLVIAIPGELRGKGRPRFGNGRTFTDAKTTNAEAWVRSCAVEQVGQPMLDGPVQLRIEYEIAIPKSWPKKKASDARCGRQKPTVKPDVDNVAKLVGDALNGIVWRDDSQIYELHVSRRYADVPKATVTIYA
ncbi:RusA family crossover junction endodeoxyribonuclease [Acetobacter sacchari]|uniref:RusA family crossover junction endodeoxyribonuclease n=2 Tax=Acetobacter sacchari TaxID=2661687 RepID=A0ABS3M173_9PROT|nr:RusA family crossover junction endodeoxyribonuclease [Acetobacter sacchari]